MPGEAPWRLRGRDRDDDHDDGSDRPNYSAPAFTNYQVLSQLFTGKKNHEQQVVLCPPGAPYVIGGGAQTTAPQTAVLTQSVPLAGPMPANGWAATGYTPGGATLDLAITVLCVA